MPAIFSDFVRSLDGPLDRERFAMAWNELRVFLRQEIKRRGLWGAPPSYLGLCGWTSWEAAADDGTAEDPLSEITAECYSFIFVDRLPALQAQLDFKPNIEGLVLLNVRHFLHERQCRHDPIGFRVFEMLQTAVEEGVAEGDFFVLAGDPAVRNDTVIGLAPTAPPDPPARDLRGLVGLWNDDLLPDLVTARGPRQVESLARLREHLRDLANHGVASFRFRDVVDPLKNDARARWAALLEPAGEPPPPRSSRPGQSGRPRRAVPPQLAIESRDRFVDLAERVAAAIEGLSTDRRTRRYLASLWSYLCAQAIAEEGALPASWEALEDDEWEHLSHRKLARLLDIPRERMPDLFATLRQLARDGESGRSPQERSRRETADLGSLR